MATRKIGKFNMENQELLRILQQQSQILQRLSLGAQPSKDGLMDKLSNSISEFSFDTNKGITFGVWYNRHEDIFLVEGKDLDDAARVRLLLRKLNPVAYEKYAAYILPKNVRDNSFEQSVKTLKDMFGFQDSIFSLRYNCFKLVKTPQEDIISYAARVNQVCEQSQIFDMSPDQFKCLVFVCGLQSHADVEVRMKSLALLEDDSNQSVNKLVKAAQRLMTLKHDTSLVEDNSVQSVNAVHTKQKFQNDLHQRENKKIPKSPCWNCGELHYSKFCEFKHHKCNQCNKFGHKDGFCKRPIQKKTSYKKNRNYQQSPKSNMVEIKQVSHSKRRKYVNVNIKTNVQDSGTDVKLQVDTASDISIIGKSTWIRLGKPGSLCHHQNATSASNNKIKLIAEFDCQVWLKGDVQKCHIYVVEYDTLSILGTDLLDAFKMWDKPLNSICCQVTKPKIDQDAISKLKTKYSSIFQDTPAKCVKTKVQLQLKENSKPVYRAKRPIAYAMLPFIEDELQRLQSLGVITPVDFSDWAAPIVAVKKPNGKIRICGDYSTGLNDVLESHRYPLPRPEDIYNKMSNSILFTHIDLSDAYLQTEVTSDSAKLLTINTHKGLFTFNRLAPGVKSAPGAFQQIMDTMLVDIEDAAAYIDDIIIGGTTMENHFENVNKVLQKLQEYNFHIKFEKCTFFANEITYLGNIMSKDGIRPDPDKIKVILNLPAPTNVKELRSFLGSINYYGKFIHQMSKLRAPLDNLLKNGVSFQWTKACQDAFQKFKKILSSELVLTHYNPSLPIKVAADASNKGLGAFICHIYPDKSEKVIAHASRTLTPAEKNYSQIEKEGLGLIYAVKKFHRYIYGREFLLCTDHKPLLSIFGSKSGIPAYAANRLQRWALTLMMYDFKIKYIKTTEFGCVDVLSRLIDTTLKPDEDIVIACTSLEDDCTAVLTDQIASLPVTFNMVLQATNKCKTLQSVISHLNNGWSTKIPQELGTYYSRREQLSVVQGCIMMNERIVIPEKLRSTILKKLHRGHPGKERMKCLARSYVYWPSIDSDIVAYVRECHQCATHCSAPIKHTLQSWPLTTKPMERIHIDIAGPCNGLYYFVIVDSFSKWPEIYEISNISSSTIISKLVEMFSRYGDAETIVSDNGTQFSSAQFSKFVADRGIKHLKTAPYHPQSNGQAERFVGTLKRALQKLKNEGTSKEILEIFLQTYRSTPKVDALSPAELFLNRKIKTILDLLKPPTIKLSSGRNEHEENIFNKKHGAKPRSFKVNEMVYAQIFRNKSYIWVPGKILERKGTVNYIVSISFKNKKQVIHSHVNQLKKRFNPNEHTFNSTQLLMEMFNLNDVHIENNSPAQTKNLFTNNQNSALSHQSVASTSDSIPQVAQDEISDSIQQVVEAEISLHSNEATSTSQNSNEAISTSQNVIRRSTRNRRAPERYQCT